MRHRLIIVAFGGLLSLSGCTNDPGLNAAGGAAVGGVVGSIVAGTGVAIIGAAAGAAVASADRW